MADFRHLILALCLTLIVLGSLSLADVYNPAAVMIIAFGIFVAAVYLWFDRRERRAKRLLKRR